MALAILLAAAIGGAAKAEMASSTVLANTCFSCHGTDGHSAGAMPTIAGKSPKFIASNLKEFRSGKRESTVMGRIAKGFSDAEIDALSQYFAKK